MRGVGAEVHVVAGLLARCTFPAPGTDVSCAVSGGPDSVALLALAVAAGCRAHAFHVDHGLRAGSATDAAVVARAAHRLGAGFTALRVDVAPGPNLEARARQARLAALPADVATGHTADDQAETVILNLLWGAGLDGLSGMAPGRRHPILGLRRQETEDLCAGLGLETLTDPTNADPSFRRNRIRHELMPLLADIGERDPVPVVARQADLLRADAALLDDLAAGIDPTDSRALAGAAVTLARRAVRRWLRPALGGYPPDAAAVDRVLAVARHDAKSTDVGRGVRVTRRQGRLAIESGQPGAGESTVRPAGA